MLMFMFTNNLFFVNFISDDRTKPFACDYCCKTFSQKCELSGHIRKCFREDQLYDNRTVNNENIYI